MEPYLVKVLFDSRDLSGCRLALRRAIQPAIAKRLESLGESNDIDKTAGTYVIRLIRDIVGLRNPKSVLRYESSIVVVCEGHDYSTTVYVYGDTDEPVDVDLRGDDDTQ